MRNKEEFEKAERKKAYEWWNAMSINEQKTLVAKHSYFSIMGIMHVIGTKNGILAMYEYFNLVSTKIEHVMDVKKLNESMVIKQYTPGNHAIYVKDHGYVGFELNKVYIPAGGEDTLKKIIKEGGFLYTKGLYFIKRKED